MSGPSCADRAPELTAYLDGELDPQSRAALEAHLATCPDCAARLDRERRLQALLRQHLTPVTAPLDVRHRVTTSIRKAAGARRAARWRTVRWVALAAVLVLAVFGGREWGRASMAGLAGPRDLLVAAHVRSLQLDHLTDVPSSEHHTVKPWFAGKLDFSPPVPDLDSAGFSLVGGRLDYLIDHPVATLVYRRRQHVINLFFWPEAGGTRSPAALVDRGFNLVHGRAGGFAYWAVSDLNAAELGQFADRVREVLAPGR